jgi:hypothetical protein
MRKKGSSTPIRLIIILSRNPNIKTKELIEKGYNAFTVRKYRKLVVIAEKELLGLK